MEGLSCAVAPLDPMLLDGRLRGRRRARGRHQPVWPGHLSRQRRLVSLRLPGGLPRRERSGDHLCRRRRVPGAARRLRHDAGGRRVLVDVGARRCADAGHGLRGRRGIPVLADHAGGLVADGVHQGAERRIGRQLRALHRAVGRWRHARGRRTERGLGRHGNRWRPSQRRGPARGCRLLLSTERDRRLV